MKYNNKVKIVFLLLIAMIFIPFYPVTVVPAWELIILDKEDKPIPKIRVNQAWKNYSLEYWKSGEHIDQDIQSNSDGYVKLPARKIRVSVFQAISSQIRDLIISINPHASFGSHSYVVCQGKYSCVVSYDDKVKQPHTVNIW